MASHRYVVIAGVAVSD